jgi:hypothetical protein
VATLLVLGSKPEPILPPRQLIDAVACANASGHSARQHGLPDPDFTVMTAVLTSGKGSDEHSLRRLQGLRTRRLYHLPRPKAEAATGLRAWKLLWRMRHLTPRHMRRRLRELGYRYDEMTVWPASRYHALVRRLCMDGQDIDSLIDAKQPSTGLIAVALGLDDPRFERVVMSGFDFSLAHAYGANPLIALRGSALSKHADTDITILRRLAGTAPRLVTTEPTVHERTGVPLWPAGAEV